MGLAKRYLEEVEVRGWSSVDTQFGSMPRRPGARRGRRNRGDGRRVRLLRHPSDAASGWLLSTSSSH